MKGFLQRSAPSYQWSSKYRPELDGLRAIAVIAVVLYHLSSSTLPSGYLGVDIFFVISGYVITYSLGNQEFKNLKDFVIKFHTKRFKRLAPALLLCILVTSLLACLFIERPQSYIKTGISALVGASNLLLFKEMVDYFGSSAELNLFTHTWSLGIEWQFYLIFPLLAWMSGYIQKKQHGKRNLLRVISLFSFLSFLTYAKWTLLGDNTAYTTAAAYFLIFPRFWELGLGCSLCLLTSGASGQEFKGNKAITPILLFAVVTIFLLPPQYAAFSRLIIVVLAGLMIGLLSPRAMIYRFLAMPSVTFIGLISYSLYLWHWPVLVLSRWTIGLHWWSVPFQIGIILSLATLSYQYVEVPLRKADWSMKTRSSIYASTLSIVMLGLFSGTYIWDSNTLYLGDKVDHASFSEADLIEHVRLCDVRNYLPKTLSDKSCGYFKDSKIPTLYLLGDSHIAQFAPAIAKFAQDSDINLSTVVGSSCLFPANLIRNKDEECFYAQEHVQKLLLNTVNTGDIVVIGNALYARFSGDWSGLENYASPGGTLIPQKEALASYIAKLKVVSEQLKGQGVQVIVFLDSAQFPDLPRDAGRQLCSPQWFRILPKACKKNHQEFIEFRRPIEQRLRNLEAKGLITIWDGLDQSTCQDGVCLPTHYRDSNHFTLSYAGYLFERFNREHPLFED
jgi:peptidoglycan/LPS O-acetylase OafA/YrhL